MVWESATSVAEDLRLRGWTADEKVGAVPESDRKVWGGETATAFGSQSMTSETGGPIEPTLSFSQFQSIVVTG